MRRPPLTPLPTLSLLLCVSLVAIWIATLHRPLTLTWTGEPAVLRGVRVHRGAVSFARVTFRTAPPPWDPKWRLNDILSWRTRAGDHRDVPAAFGFDFYDERPATNNVMFSAGTLAFRVMFVPMWAIVAITGVIPLLRLRRALYRRVARRQGLCPECGYDLRATPERCPECGCVPTASRRRCGSSPAQRIT